MIRSSRRKKTAQASLVGTTIEIRIPARCSAAEEVELVEHFTAKFERSRSTDAIDLDARARRLADSYRLPRPTSIRWVSNQRQRWGSCTVGSGDIRISDRLVDVPPWVLDSVLIHELAHLVVANHGPAFEALVRRYPLHERATGYLMAVGDRLNQAAG